MAAPFPEIELKGPSEEVTAAVPRTGNVGGDELSKPLVRLEAVEAPKANTAGVDDVDIPVETVLSSDLNVCPAFCISLLTRIDPSVKAVVALLRHNKNKLKNVNGQILERKPKQYQQKLK